MDLLLLSAVFILGFVTMFFGAISGGVGLVTRPILVLLGFPAASVISSSRVAGSVGEWPGLFLLRKHIDWKKVIFLAIPMIIGSLLSAWFVITTFKKSLNIIFGIFLLLAGLFFLFKGKLGLKEKKNKFSNKTSAIIAFIGTIPISFFNVLTGGLGPLYSFFYVWIYGKSFISASAMWRVASNISSISSAIVFIIAGVVDWQLCIALMIGFALGSFFGTRFGLKKGESWVRYIVLIITFAGAIKLLFFS